MPGTRCIGRPWNADHPVAAYVLIAAWVFPLQYVASIGETFLVFRPTDLVSLVLGIALLGRLAVTNHVLAPGPLGRILLLLAVVLLFISILSWLAEGSTLRGAIQIIQMAELFILAWALAYTLGSPQRRLRALKFLALVSAGLGILAILWSLLQPGGFSDPRRLFGGNEFLDTQPFFFIGLALLVLLTTEPFHGRDPVRRLAWIVLVLLMAFATILSQARMVWLAVTIIGALWLMLLPSRRARLVGFALGLLVLAIPLWLVLPDAVTRTTSARFGTIVKAYDQWRHQETVRETGIGPRVANYRFLLDVVPDKLALGYGPSTTTKILSAQMGYQGPYAPVGHNIYADVVVRYGVVGLLAFVGLVWLPAARAAKAVRRRESPDALALFALATYGGIIMAFNSQGKESWILFAIVLALTLGLTRSLCAKERRLEPQGPTTRRRSKGADPSDRTIGSSGGR